MAGAVLTGFAPAVGVVAPSTPPAFVSWPLLLLLAVLAPALSLWLARKGRTVLAASLLLGPAALAPGRMVLDSQLAVDAGLAARPELMLPVTLVRFTPSAGLWMLMCGNAATVIAGVFAMISLGRARDPVPGGFDIDTAGASRRQGQLTFVLCVAVLGAVSVLMPQFVSGTPYLVPRAAVDSPLLVLAGSLLIAVAVPTVGGFVAGATDREMTRGGLLGLAIALATIVIPPLAAATFVAQIHYDSGGVLGLVAALAMVGLAWSAGRTDERVRSGAPRIPSLTRLLALTGGLAVIAGVLAVVGAMSPQWALPSGISTVSYPARMLWPSGLVMVVLGGGVLFPTTALRVPPRQRWTRCSLRTRAPERARAAVHGRPDSPVRWRPWPAWPRRSQARSSETTWISRRWSFAAPPRCCRWWCSRWPSRPSGFRSSRRPVSRRQDCSWTSRSRHGAWCLAWQRCSPRSCSPRCAGPNARPRCSAVPR
jgi:hypothetical protein